MALLIYLIWTLEIIQPGTPWQVPFEVHKTGLGPSGKSVFASEQTIYLYSSSGQLLNEFDSGESVEGLWIDNHDSIWVLSSDQLRVFSSHGRMIDAVEILPQTLGPFFMQNSPILVNEMGITLFQLNHIEPLSGKAPSIFQITLNLENLYSVNTSGREVLICKQNNQHLLWYPIEGASYPFQTLRQQKTRFFTSSPKHSKALVYEDGVLEVQTPKHRWQRSFTLDTQLAPVWLQHDKKEVLAFVAEDRVFRIFGANGVERERKLLNHRPLHLLNLDPQRVILTMYQSRDILIYDFSTDAFFEETLEATVIDIVRNGHYLLLLNKEGHIRLLNLKTKP